jgi:phage tail sheath gpL-like
MNARGRMLDYHLPKPYRSERSLSGQGKHGMGINSESDISANLQIGPTTAGMVRIYVAGDGIDLPLDFDPEEAEEIADELRSAAQAARKMAENAKGKKR